MPVAQDFEDSEFTVPFDRLKNAGHEVTVFGCRAGEIVIGKRGQARATIDRVAADMEPDDFDALVIPGGYSPDHLRLDEDVVAFVRRFCETGKPVAAICHGPQLLIEADVVRDRRMTSWPSVRTDLRNAGAKWIDCEVAVDGNLITSRKPADLEAFCDEILDRLRDSAAREAQPRRARKSRASAA
jgi:protease I